MNDTELKLEIFKLIDTQKGNELRQLYYSLKNIITRTERNSKSYATDLEEQYKLMAQDIKRESEAIEWIEGSKSYDTI